jgi:predicted RND superfamily exporter protein
MAISTDSIPTQSFLSKVFSWWARVSYDRAYLVLSACIIILGLLFSQIPKVVFDMSNEAMLHKTDSIRTNYENFKQEFGREDAIILSLEIPDGLDERVIAKVFELQNQIENEVPYLREITTILNVSYTYGEHDDIIVEDLLEGYPNHKWEYDELSEYMLSHPLYRNRLISGDGKHLVIALDLQTFDFSDEESKPLSDQQSAESVDALKEIIDAHPDWKIRMTGEPVLLDTINYLTSRDNALTASIAFLVVVFLLLFFFRRRSGLFIPLLVITGSMTGSIGVMGFTGSPYTLISTTTYALIIGMSIADSLHILTIFYRQFQQSGNKRESIIYAMSHSAPAVTLTTVTTAIGFLSFTTGDLASTSQLGISAAAAVFFALFFTVSLTPSLLSLFDIKQHANTQSVNLYLENFLKACAHVSTTYPKSISIASILLFIACIYGSTFLGFSHDPISNFPDDTRAKIENQEIDKIYGGYTSIEVIIDTEKSGGIYEDSFVSQLTMAADSLSNTEINGIKLGASKSVIDIIKETHRALNGNSDEFYKVPEDGKLIAQEILLYELNNADDLFKHIDRDYSKVRLTLFTNHDDGVVYEKLISGVDQRLKDIFQEEVVITVTGANALVAGSVPRALRTMLKSYIVASVLIVLVMIIVVKSVRIGLISIIPNLLPIAFVMNFIVLLGIPLDLSTILVGAVAMGIVVDDSLHFLYHFKNYFQETGDAKLAIRKTHLAVGPALFMTTVVFSLCCTANMVSSIFGVNMFGWSLAAITVLALLADLLIAPALLMFFLPSVKKALATE